MFKMTSLKILIMSIAVFIMAIVIILTNTSTKPSTTSKTYDNLLANKTINEGVYKLKPVHAETKCLDLLNSKLTRGTRTQISSDKETSTQKWEIVNAGNGYYKLLSQASKNMALDVSGSSNAKGTKVQIWNDNNTNAQKWKFADAGNGCCMLEPACAPGKYLDVDGASTKDGAKLIIWPDNRGNNQKWQLVPVTISSSPSPTTTPTPSKSPVVTTSPTITPSPSQSPSTQNYPEKEIAVYKMMWSSNGPKLSEIGSQANVVRIAFAQGDPPTLVGYGNQGKESFKADMAAMRNRGVKFVISVGGSGGALNPANRNNFINGIDSIKNTLGGLDGIDWDIEASSMVKDDVVAISKALVQKYGTNFAITFAPNGGNVGQYLPTAVECQKAGILTSYGQQFYDSPVSVSAASGRIQQAIDAGIPVSKIGVGMMIASDSNHWTNQQCKDNMNALRSKFPGLQRVYLWEASRNGTAQWLADMKAIVN